MPLILYIITLEDYIHNFSCKKRAFFDEKIFLHSAYLGILFFKQLITSMITHEVL